MQRPQIRYNKMKQLSVSFTSVHVNLYPFPKVSDIPTHENRGFVAVELLIISELLSTEVQTLFPIISMLYAIKENTRYILMIEDTINTRDLWLMAHCPSI